MLCVCCFPGSILCIEFFTCVCVSVLISLVLGYRVSVFVCFSSDISSNTERTASDCCGDLHSISDAVRRFREQHFTAWHCFLADYCCQGLD